MDNEFGVKSGEREISPQDPDLQYMGRIDMDQIDGPVMVYPSSYVKIRFIGTYLRVEVSNYHLFWDNYFGVIIDGVQSRFRLPDSGRMSFELVKELTAGEHEVILFKRMDSCHLLQFHGFYVNEGAQLLTPAPLPRRKLEVYGDSVSAGEVAEAVYYEGQPDPYHQGQYHNSYFSYAWMTARKAGAQIHNIAQGGIALLDRTGWYGAPDYVGMENVYYKIQYNPALGETKEWDFSRYTPDIVVIAIGQNDSHPVDFMAEDYQGEQAAFWKERYGAWMRQLLVHYPRTHIVLTTTILEHHPNWDRAIQEVCDELEDPRVSHFLYQRNGKGTKGHIRIQEAEEMAGELAAYLEPLWPE
jgi:hypothetical protein